MDFITTQDRELVVKITEAERNMDGKFSKNFFMCVMCVNGLKIRYLGMRILRAILNKGQNALVFARFTPNG